MHSRWMQKTKHSMITFYKTTFKRKLSTRSILILHAIQKTQLPCSSVHMRNHKWLGPFWTFVFECIPGNIIPVFVKTILSNRYLGDYVFFEVWKVTVFQLFALLVLLSIIDYYFFSQQNSFISVTEIKISKMSYLIIQVWF